MILDNKPVTSLTYNDSDIYDSKKVVHTVSFVGIKSGDDSDKKKADSLSPLVSDIEPVQQDYIPEAIDYNKLEKAVKSGVVLGMEQYLKKHPRVGLKAITEPVYQRRTPVYDITDAVKVTEPKISSLSKSISKFSAVDKPVYSTRNTVAVEDALGYTGAISDLRRDEHDYVITSQGRYVTAPSGKILKTSDIGLSLPEYQASAVKKTTNALRHVFDLDRMFKLSVAVTAFVKGVASIGRLYKTTKSLITDVSTGLNITKKYLTDHREDIVSSVKVISDVVKSGASKIGKVAHDNPDLARGLVVGSVVSGIAGYLRSKYEKAVQDKLAIEADKPVDSSHYFMTDSGIDVVAYPTAVMPQEDRVKTVQDPVTGFNDSTLDVQEKPVTPTKRHGLKSLHKTTKQVSTQDNPVVESTVSPVTPVDTPVTAYNQPLPDIEANATQSTSLGMGTGSSPATNMGDQPTGVDDGGEFLMTALLSMAKDSAEKKQDTTKLKLIDATAKIANIGYGIRDVKNILADKDRTEREKYQDTGGVISNRLSTYIPKPTKLIHSVVEKVLGGSSLGKIAQIGIDFAINSAVSKVATKAGKAVGGAIADFRGIDKANNKQEQPQAVSSSHYFVASDGFGIDKTDSLTDPNRDYDRKQAVVDTVSLKHIDKVELDGKATDDLLVPVTKIINKLESVQASPVVADTKQSMSMDDLVKRVESKTHYLQKVKAKDTSKPDDPDIYNITNNYYGDVYTDPFTQLTQSNKSIQSWAGTPVISKPNKQPPTIMSVAGYGVSDQPDRRSRLNDADIGNNPVAVGLNLVSAGMDLLPKVETIAPKSLKPPKIPGSPKLGGYLDVAVAGVNSYDIVNSDQISKRDKIAGVGEQVGGALGGIGAGVLAGAAAGSIVPVIGTIGGAAVGFVAGIIGNYIGGWLGGKGGEAIADAVGETADKSSSFYANIDAASTKQQPTPSNITTMSSISTNQPVTNINGDQQGAPTITGQKMGTNSSIPQRSTSPTIVESGNEITLQASPQVHKAAMAPESVSRHKWSSQEINVQAPEAPSSEISGRANNPQVSVRATLDEIPITANEMGLILLNAGFI